MLAGYINGNKIDLNTLFEGVGSVAAGTMTKKQLRRLEQVPVPAAEAAPACLRQYDELPEEVLGMGLPGNGTIPAVDAVVATGQTRR